MIPLVIVKTGTTLATVSRERGDFEDWITAGMDVDRQEATVVEVHRGHLPPEPDRVRAVVVTGSAAMVSDHAAWSVSSGRWLARVIRRGIPMLGICYGHQLVADAMGGRVGKNPRGREIGTIDVQLVDGAERDPLFSVLSPTARFQATHIESVLELPRGARRLATSPLDGNQAFAIGARGWCVQFHPECDARVIREYIQARRHAIGREGLDPDLLVDRTVDSPDGSILLRRFAELAGLRQP